MAGNTLPLREALADIAHLHYVDGPRMDSSPSRPWWILDSDLEHDIRATDRWKDVVSYAPTRSDDEKLIIYKGGMVVTRAIQKSIRWGYWPFTGRCYDGVATLHGKACLKYYTQVNILINLGRVATISRKGARFQYNQGTTYSVCNPLFW